MGVIGRNLSANWFRVTVASFAITVPLLCSWAIQGFGNSSEQGSAYSNGSIIQTGASRQGFKPLSNADNPQEQEVPKSRGTRSGNGLVDRPALGQSGLQQDAIGQTSQPYVDGTTTQCTVEYVDEIDIPALETGQLIELSVRESDEIPEGKTIGRIDDTLIKHARKQAEITKNNAQDMASDQTQIEAANKQIQLNRKRFESTARLAAKGARSLDEKLVAQYEWEVAKLQRQAAEVRQREAFGTAELEAARFQEADDRLKRHAIVCPFDGSVVQMFKQKGEWVTAGDPVAKVARMNKLYVTGLISNRLYNPDQVEGKEVVVTVRLAGDETKQFNGRIVLTGLEVLGGTGESANEFRIKAEIKNEIRNGQWILRKGANVSMRIKL